MSRARFTSLTLLAVAGFALIESRTATAQNPLPTKPDTSLVRPYYEDPPTTGFSQDQLKTVRANFATYTKYFADTIAHPSVWKASTELKLDTKPVDNAPPTFDMLFADMNRFIIDPVPANANKLKPGHADFNRELGAAYDAAFKNLIETSQERIVRVNAARALAHVARTGAPAHYATITELLTAPNTPTEVRYYLFQAAGAALSAYDVTELKTRKHTVDNKTLGDLVKALQGCITNPALIMPGYKADTATPEELAVITFVRRHAVKALGQVRFAQIDITERGKTEKTYLYPAHTLARVALSTSTSSDPALGPLPGPAEAAEAAIGICNMAPPPKGYNSDAAIEAVAQGLLTFAGPRAGDVTNRTLPWRSYSLRIAEAMMRWRMIYDQDYNPLEPNKYDTGKVPAAVEEFYKDVTQKVLFPMEKVDKDGKPDATATIDLSVLRTRLKARTDNPNRGVTLFAGVKETSTEFAAPKEK